MQRSILFLLLLIFTGICPLFSQDLHLTQFYTSTISLNPALTGNFEGDIRLSFNHRQQWGQIATPIKTTLFSVEKNMTKRAKGFGVGVLLMDDQTGLRQIRTSRALGSVSYLYPVGRNNFSLGIQAGMSNRSIDMEGQSYPSQWNYETGNYETSIPNGESGLQNSTLAGDINMGIGWSREVRRVTFSAGYSVFHLNKPKDKLMLNNKSIPFRHVVHSSALCPLNHSLQFQPQLLYMQTAGVVSFLGTANFVNSLNKNARVSAGVGYRGSNYNSDAIFGIIGYGKNRITLALSMDFNISLLSREARRKSVWELSVSYTTPSRIIKQMAIPCERF